MGVGTVVGVGVGCGLGVVLGNEVAVGNGVGLGNIVGTEVAAATDVADCCCANGVVDDDPLHAAKVMLKSTTNKSRFTYPSP